MKFKNRQNICHKIDGRDVWESRSVAVVGVIIIYRNGIPYVLVSRRGPNSADYQGKMNLVAGYLDWDESGTEALSREAWEETGFDLTEHLETLDVIRRADLTQPWSVTTRPGENHQNVTLRYGVCFHIPKDSEFPSLTTEHNEIEGECEDPQWMALELVGEYEWAFNHDRVILDYYNKINDIP